MISSFQTRPTPQYILLLSVKAPPWIRCRYGTHSFALEFFCKCNFLIHWLTPVMLAKQRLWISTKKIPACAGLRLWICCRCETHHTFMLESFYRCNFLGREVCNLAKARLWTVHWENSSLSRLHDNSHAYMIIHKQFGLVNCLRHGKFKLTINPMD